MLKSRYLLVTFMAFAGAAHGESAAGAGDPILVTVTRLPTMADQVGSSVTVLDKQDIDAAQAVVTSELLARTPGVSFSRNGGVGTTTHVRIRGAESDQTVVVIDGVKVNDPSTTGGGYNFANLLVGDTSRIEILRGPQSILWGSQAIGGVVNIVSAMPEGPLQGSFDLEGGSRNTVYGRAAVGGGSERLSWRVAGSSFTTDGISAYSKRAGAREADGSHSRAASARVKLGLSDVVSIDLRGSYSDSSADLDSTTGDTAAFADVIETIGYAGLNFDLLDGRFSNRIAFSYTSTDRDQFNPALSVPRTLDARGENRRWEYQGNLVVVPGWTVMFGAETERAMIRTASPTIRRPDPIPVRGKDRTDSLYGLVQAQPLEGLTMTAGVRHADHDGFGGATLLGASAAWALNGGATVLRVSYGEGFKAPTPYQLLSLYGNSALKPETARGWDAGVRQRLFGGRMLVTATYFSRRTSDLIDFVSCSGRTGDVLCEVDGVSRLGYYANIARAKAHGIELEASVALAKGLQLDGNYTWTDTANRSAGTNFGKWLDRRPRHTANGRISYQWPFGLNMAVAVRYAGKSANEPENLNWLDSYTLVDLRASMPLARGLELFARAENLFDEHYETAHNYGALSRGIHAGVRVRL